MKILHIHNYYRFPGGEEIMFEAITRMLIRKGHAVHVFKRDSSTIRGLLEKIGAFIQSLHSFSSCKTIVSILGTDRPDIVHFHNLYPLISPSVLAACRRFDIPTVMTCHNFRLVCPKGLLLDNCERCRDGAEYWCVLKNCRGDIFESAVYALQNMVARKWRLFRDNVTMYISPSDYIKNRLVRGGFPPERITVIPNMVSLDASASRNSHGAYIAYAGRISSEKGIETLLSGARRTGLPLRLAGDYSPMPDVLETAPPNVEFLGPLSREQLSQFYRNAHFAVIPSICAEVFPLVAGEAMSHGLPVIASRTGGLPEIVDDGVTGFLVEPGDAGELSEAMKRLWENPVLCRRMGRAGRGKAQREYSGDAYYGRLMAAYRKALEMNGTHSPGHGKDVS